MFSTPVAIITSLSKPKPKQSLDEVGTSGSAAPWILNVIELAHWRAHDGCIASLDYVEKLLRRKLQPAPWQ